MKKIDLGQTLQILGNVGVIVGILLLVYELNQNRELTRAQTRNAIAETLVNMLTLQSSTPEYLEMSTKQVAGEPLSREEELMFRLNQFAYWRYRENVFYQSQRGLFEETEYLGQRDVWVQSINSNEAVRSIWCGRRRQQSAAFSAEIDVLIDRACE